MNISLDEIKKPIENHISEFEKEYKQHIQSPVPLLDKITKYILKSKGKQINSHHISLL